MPQIPKTPTPFEGAPEYAGNISEVFQKMGQMLFGGGPERAMDLIGGPMMTDWQLADTAQKMIGTAGVTDEVIESLMTLRDRLNAGLFDPTALEHLEHFILFPKGAYGPNTVGLTGYRKNALGGNDLVRAMMLDEVYAQKQLVPPGSFQGIPQTVGIDPTFRSRRVLPHEIEHLIDRTSPVATPEYKLVESLYPQAKTGQLGSRGIDDFIQALMHSDPAVPYQDIAQTISTKYHYTNPNELVADIAGYRQAYPYIKPHGIETPMAQWLRQGGFPVEQRPVVQRPLDPGRTPPPRVAEAWKKMADKEKLP